MSTAAASMYSVTVSAGETFSGHTIPLNGEVQVQSGGTIEAISTRDSDTIYVSAGGVATDIILTSSVLYEYGSATSVTVGAGSELDEIGGHVVGAEVLPGGTETVDGYSSSSVIAGGSQIVSGTASGAILSGGLQEVVNGSAIDTLVLSGGEQFVSSSLLSPRVTGTSVGAGGLAAATGGTEAGLTVQSGGQAVLATPAGATGIIDPGGLIAILPQNGGTADLSGLIVEPGASLLVIGGATMSGALVDPGASAIFAAADVLSTVAAGDLGFVVSAGNILTGGTLGQNEQMNLYAGGLAEDNFISGGEQVITSGGIATGATIVAGFGQYVLDGGVASQALVSGGEQYLSYGVASLTVAVSGGEQVVGEGGTAILATVDSGGCQFVSSIASNAPALAVSTFVQGGTETLSTYASATDTTIAARGTQTIGISGLALSASILAGGTQTVSRLGTAVDTIVSAGGMLVLAGGSATLVSLSRGATVDFTKLAYTTGISASINATDLMVVHDGGQTATLQLQGSYAGDSEIFSPDAKGRLLVTLVASAGTTTYHDLAHMPLTSEPSSPHAWPTALGAAETGPSAALPESPLFGHHG